MGATAAGRSRGSDADSLDQLVADVFDRNCPSRSVMQNVAGKWGTLAMVALLEGSFRFNALRRRIDGVSEKMLSQTLQALERDGLVTRDVRSAIPPRVDYALTDVGRRIAGQLLALIQVLEDAMPQINDARTAYADRER